MKRILILCILLVLAAAVINLAIALGFWRYGKRPSKPGIIDNRGIVEIGRKELSAWRDSRQPDWPSHPEGGYRYKFFGITHRSLYWLNEEWSGSPSDVNFKMIKVDHYFVFNTEFGWPLQCIANERWTEMHETEARSKASDMLFVLGVPAPNHVLWMGMFINILYYCFSIALAFLCVSYIRRGLRRMHNRFIKCGYDLRGVAESGCPECGWGREAEA